MKIRIISVGDTKSNELKLQIDKYKKLISKFAKVEIINVKTKNINTKSDKEIEKIKEQEGLDILNNIKGYSVALDRTGKELTSIQFAKEIQNIANRFNSTITFIIGGSHGLSKDVLSRVNEKTSFSKMTFPHQLFKVLLLEQVYRAFSILNHMPYHK
ncbi:MAG: 23S rRNA (pseudouridine(1915)-N(3))-methyltransferase RlmH [archaeon]